MTTCSLEFRIRLEYSFEHGLKLMLIDPDTGEILSSSVSAAGLLHSLSDYVNRVIFTTLHPF